jgi:hypothetical protein
MADARQHEPHREVTRCRVSHRVIPWRYARRSVKFFRAPDVDAVLATRHEPRPRDGLYSTGWPACVEELA